MMAFQTYWPVIFLSLIPFLWWVRTRTRTGMNPPQLTLIAALRSALVALLALALMQPVLYRSGSWLSVVYLLDVSQSVAPESVAAAIDWIEQTQARGRPDHARFIPFAANSMVLDSIQALRTVPVAPRPLEGAIDQSGTHLEDALVQAAGSFAPYHLNRLVLITDGHENAGAVRNTVLRLQDENVPVFTRPIQTRSGRDAWVEAILAPRQATEKELFPVEVHVYSQLRTAGSLEVRAAGQVLESREIELEAGLNRLTLEVRVEEAGPAVLEAEARIDGDRFPENNVWRESVAVAGPPRILYIEGRRESSQYLAETLVREGLVVDVVSPAETPRRIDELDAYDAIVLSDVRADSLTADQMEAVVAYVRDLGGGFILAGGDSVYGEDGYSGTRIEEILPVRFDLEDEPKSVALALVLDKSGSMGGVKIELAKEAAKAAVDALKDDHFVGVVAFDYNYYWPVPMQPAENRDDINRRISRLLAGGETNIYPALQDAYLELDKLEAEIKHVILMSDGRSLPDRFSELVGRMLEANITVSTVGIGAGTDRQLMTAIAQWGQGREYYIADSEVRTVPQIFAEETQLATQGTLEERPFHAVVRKEVEALKGIDFASGPPLLGFVSTIAKDTAEVILESDEATAEGVVKPILARWQYGLGKTVAFTSDVKNRWAADWLEWEGYGKFWPQLVRETMRRQQDGDFDLVVERDGTEARVVVTGLDPDGGFRPRLDAQLRVIDPDQQVSVVDLHQVGPGSFQARVPTPLPGGYLFRLVGDGVNAARALPYSYPEEYRFRPPDADLLRQISAETGGIFAGEADAIFGTEGNTVVRPTNLWPYLAALALLVYLSELLVRRLRLFEPALAPARTIPSTPHDTRGSLGIS